MDPIEEDQLDVSIQKKLSTDQIRIITALICLIVVCGTVYFFLADTNKEVTDNDSSSLTLEQKQNIIQHAAELYDDKEVVPLDLEQKQNIIEHSGSLYDDKEVIPLDLEQKQNIIEHSNNLLRNN